MTLKFKIVETKLNNGTVEKRLWVKKCFSISKMFSERKWEQCYVNNLPKYPNFSTRVFEYSDYIKRHQFEDAIKYMNNAHEKEKGMKIKSVKETFIK